MSPAAAPAEPEEPEDTAVAELRRYCCTVFADSSFDHVLNHHPPPASEDPLPKIGNAP